MTNTLFQTKFGSVVYGTNLPTSDIDVGRVFLETPTQIYGVQEDRILAQKIEGGFDTREVFLQRFIKLCVNGNPNVLEWLYTPKEHIDYIDEDFKTYIFDRANLFLQKQKIIDSHLGFAKSQIIKMRKHEQEMGAKRKELYAKFGYDVKYASHAVRLTHQLGDILTYGRIVFPYPKEMSEFIKSIKRGDLSLKDFDFEYEKALAKINTIIEDTASHKVQEKVNYADVARLLEYVYIKHFYPSQAESLIAGG